MSTWRTSCPAAIRQQELPILFLLRANFLRRKLTDLSERLSANARAWMSLRRGWKASVWLCAGGRALLRHSGNRSYDGAVLLQAAWLGNA